ncbi:hypothetical protein CIP107554_00690 [Corynebacterium diphtheriae]|nr:hypothetical protein CIP107554_00690 [Corynebacterium diphtheriae]
MGVSDELSGLKAGNRLAGAGGVPDVAAQLVAAVPVVTVHTVSDTRGRIVLVGTHRQQVARDTVSDGVEADELVRHRNGQQRTCHVVPLVDRLVVEVGPVEEVVRVELACARVGEVDRLLRGHGDEDLHQGEDALVDALMGVLGYLVRTLGNRHAGALQLDVEDRHTVDEQHHVATSGGQ